MSYNVHVYHSPTHLHLLIGYIAGCTQSNNKGCWDCATSHPSFLPATTLRSFYPDTGTSSHIQSTNTYIVNLIQLQKVIWEEKLFMLLIVMLVLYTLKGFNDSQSQPRSKDILTHMFGWYILKNNDILYVLLGIKFKNSKHE